MRQELPAWAMGRVTAGDRPFVDVQQAHRHGSTRIQLPNLKALRGWAKDHGWPTPWFGFESAFIAKMFESPETFALALAESGVEISLPVKEHTLTVETLKNLDGLYDERSDSGRPTGWGVLVEELREIRRAVEAGVTIRVAGTDTVLNSWQRFYEWAHGRYHMLEDGADSWIGDDES